MKRLVALLILAAACASAQGPEVHPWWEGPMAQNLNLSADQQKQILTQLAFTLEGVMTQQLIPRSRGTGRVMCAEVLVCTPAIKAVIREGKIHQIYSLMQAGQKYGMQTMNQALMQSVLDKHLTAEDALERSMDRAELESMLQKVMRSAA